MEQTPVLIAGGGPVGLMMALELNFHGVTAILIERNETTTRHPKMDITNGRSMELFRRLGVIDALRTAAVPEDHIMSVIWIDKLDGFEVARFDYPSVNDRRAQLHALNDGSMACEPSMRISQVDLEPVLKQHIEQNCPHIDVRFGWGLESFVQDSEGVTATIKHTVSGELQEVRCQYLAGCDGASSITRRTLGIPINTITPADFMQHGEDHHNYLDTARGEPAEGSEKPRAMFMIHWTSPDLALFEHYGTAWHLQSVAGWTVISQNDKDTWTVHLPLDAIGDWENRDPKEILFQFMGCEFECEIKVANPWYPRLALADSYGQGRVWLAGDSAHQVIPTGGYGMNSGLGDATGLAWVLAANLNGWGGPGLFTAYENERRHVGARIRIGSARHSAVRFKIASQYDPIVHQDSPDGAAARAKIGQFIIAAGNLENEAWGIEWGYRYADSPAICHEDGDSPPYEWEAYVPSTWPGGRPPNVFFDSGEPLYDHLGVGFTLVCCGASSAAMETAAAAANVPLTVVHIDDDHVTSLYEQPLVLIRPDQIVAWRGDQAPNADELASIFKTVTGR